MFPEFVVALMVFLSMRRFNYHSLSYLASCVAPTNNDSGSALIATPQGSMNLLFNPRNSEQSVQALSHELFSSLFVFIL